MEHKSNLIRSRFGQNEKYTAIYLIDGTKISIGRDRFNSAWIKVEKTPVMILDDVNEE